MTVHSIFGAVAPPGDYAVHADGAPSITLGATFYVTADMPNAKAIGGRLWTPVGAPAQVTIMGWAGPVTDTQNNIGTVPTQSKTVATNPGGWTEATFDAPFDMPGAGYRVMIGYEFSDATNYVSAQSARPNPGTALQASDGASLFLSPASTTDPSGAGVHAEFFRIGTGAVTSPGSDSTLYGVDILVDDNAAPPPPNQPPVANAGADKTVLTGSTVTLTGSGSDADGSVVSVAWEQTSGTAVALSGTGYTRTFTAPSATGPLGFRLTVTDDDGATATDDVTITVNAPVPPPAGSNRVHTLLEAIASCLCAQIVADGLPPTCFCGVVPGDAAVGNYAGDCEEACGMAWVRLVTAYPASAVGTPNIEAGNCNAGLGLEVEVGIMRCISIGDEQGNPPPPEEMLAAAELQTDDMFAMMRAITCCPSIPSKDFILSAYTPMGPLGGVVGGTYTIALAI